MPNNRIITKFLDLLTMVSVFITPLVFFTHSRDQFELPKLTLLALLVLPILIFRSREKAPLPWTPLTLSLIFFIFTQILASLPWTSLSWRTSLLGDYDNFAGLSTLLIFLFWFMVLNPALNEARLERIFFFNSIAAILSALYAGFQHFGFDFIPWNPASVNATREFAAMGNPNFLSAYLAMSLPPFLYLTLKPILLLKKTESPPLGLTWVWPFVGGILLIIGFAISIFTSLLPPFAFIPKITGLVLLSGGLGKWSVPCLGSLVLGFGLFSAASRGGFLAALIGLAVLFGFALFQGDEKKRLTRGLAGMSKSSLALSILVSLAAAATLASFGTPFLKRLFDSTTHLGESLAVSRLHIWRPALEMIKENPLWGTGLDTFKIAFPFYSGIEFNLIDGMFMSSRMAHNELLQISATTGLLGLVSYLSLLLAFGWMWWKTYRSTDHPTQWLLIVLLASAAAYHVQNLFSFGVGAINFLWFIILAAVQHFYRKVLARNPATSPSPFLPAFFRKTLVLLSVLFVFGFALPRFGADIAFGRGNAVSEMLKKHDPQMSQEALLAYSDYGIEQIKKSVSLCPLDVKYQLYLGLAFEQRAQLDQYHSRENLLEALRLYQISTQMSPANAYYYNDLGRIYNSLILQDARYIPFAEEAFGKAVQWAPASPFFRVNWAMALRRNGKEKEARDVIQRAFILSPSFTSKVLAQMAFEAYREGNKKSAFDRVEEAVQGNPLSPEALYCRGILYLSEREKKRALEDFEAVKKLNPTPEKNPSIQSLDKFIEQAKN